MSDLQSWGDRVLCLRGGGWGVQGSTQCDKGTGGLHHWQVPWQSVGLRAFSIRQVNTKDRPLRLTGSALWGGKCGGMGFL